VYKIGVFDSGIGGKSVANAIEIALPEDEVIFINDSKNVPYGTKTPEELHNLVLPILHDLAGRVDVVVIACNTISTLFSGKLREAINKPIVALDPMIKPASEQTKTGVIAVCATPATLRSDRYAWLKQEHASNITVLEPDCSNWSALIEANSMDTRQIEDMVNDACSNKADVIVLGCTHYHWIEHDIKKVAHKYGAKVIQPESAIVKQVKRVLGRLR